MSSEWSIPASDCSLATINPIRNIVDKIKRPVNHPLPIIDLALGDPTVFGNLPPDETTTDAVLDVVKNPKVHGYTNSLGHPAAREAIAKFMRRDGVDYEAKDIITASGASQAILLVIQLLCNPGDCLLIPTPGFSLYETICGHLGVECLPYRLIPEKKWEADLDHVTQLITDATAAGKKVRGFLLNNPGNPTGSNFSRQHLIDTQAVVEKFKLPVIADEIYSYLTFSGETFTPFAQISGDVPVFTINGLAKQFLVPGWRIGWIAVCDRKGYLTNALPHLTSLTQVVLGCTTLIQHAIPRILETLPKDHYTRLGKVLEQHSKTVIDCCSKISGLTCIAPQGAMYVMIQIDPTKFTGIKDDTEFCQKLLDEENVMLLPGACFHAPNFFRVVFCAPQDKIEEFASRLQRFCDKYRV